MSNWTTSKLSDVIEIIGGGTPKRSENKYWNGDIPWLSVADFNNDFRYVNDSIEHITELGLQKSSTKLLDKDHLIISARGTVGCLAQLSVPMAFNQSCYGLNGKEGILDNGFLYYFLKNNISELKQKTHGAVFDTITRDTFEHIQISYPDLDTQKEIAKNLGSFDEKIQLNTQINQTLEQIAQALFKSWFVDFDPVRAKVQALSDCLSLEQAELAAMQAIGGKTSEELTALSQTQPDRYAELAETAKAFPCEMEEIDGVEVPKGWEYKPADELFDIGIGKTPPRKETEWFSTNLDDMQWISIKDMGNSGVFITESSEFLTNQAVDKFNIRKIPENTVLLSFKLTIGRVSITTCETTTNEAIAHFKITDKSFLTTEYLYLFFQQFDFNSLGSTSSIATAVNSKTIKGIEILIPNEELIKAFKMKISNIFAQIQNLTMENKNLVKTRDLLLPKLLNREI
ncbi:MAG: restriction endonuclease subunit S [Haemophilus parainfluenzae]